MLDMYDLIVGKIYHIDDFGACEYVEFYRGKYIFHPINTDEFEDLELDELDNVFPY